MSTKENIEENMNKISSLMTLASERLQNRKQTAAYNSQRQLVIRHITELPKSTEPLLKQSRLDYLRIMAERNTQYINSIGSPISTTGYRDVTQAQDATAELNRLLTEINQATQDTLTDLQAENAAIMRTAADITQNRISRNRGRLTDAIKSLTDWVQVQENVNSLTDDNIDKIAQILETTIPTVQQAQIEEMRFWNNVNFRKDNLIIMLKNLRDTMRRAGTNFRAVAPALIFGAGPLALVGNGISWAGATTGTSLAIASSNMTLSQLLFDSIIVGPGQRLGALMLTNTWLAPALISLFTLSLILLLPPEYLVSMRQLIINFIVALSHAAVNGAIWSWEVIYPASMAVLNMADRLFRSGASTFISLCQTVARRVSLVNWSEILSVCSARLNGLMVSSGFSSLVSSIISRIRSGISSGIGTMSSSLSGSNITSLALGRGPSSSSSSSSYSSSSSSSRAGLRPDGGGGGGGGGGGAVPGTGVGASPGGGGGGAGTPTVPGAGAGAGAGTGAPDITIAQAEIQALITNVRRKTRITDNELEQARQQLQPITSQDNPNTSNPINNNVSDDNTNTGTSTGLITPALYDVVISSPDSNIGQKADASLNASQQASQQVSEQNSQQEVMEQQGPALNTGILIAKLNELANGYNQGQEPKIKAVETTNNLTGETVLTTTVTVQGQQSIVTKTIVEPNGGGGGTPGDEGGGEDEGGGGGGRGGGNSMNLKDSGRRRKSYRRKPKTSTKKKQYRRRIRNTRRRQKRNTKKKHYRRMRRR
jgi:hypothetical protein